MKSVASVPESAEEDHSAPQVGSTQFDIQIAQTEILKRIMYTIVTLRNVVAAR